MLNPANLLEHAKNVYTSQNMMKHAETSSNMLRQVKTYLYMFIHAETI